MNKNTSSLVVTVWLLLLLAAFVAIHADAQTVPALINYQGKLVNSNGLPVSTGDYELRFRIYDDVTNGNLIWGPQVFNGHTGPGYGPVVAVVQGWFNVMLGPMDTNGVPIASAFNSTNRFIEVTIGAGSPITPRQQILSAPYAFRAEVANRADQATTALAAGIAVTASNAYALRAAGGSQSDAVTVTPSGNVGIGTAFPAATLDVAGQIKITGGSPGLGKVLTSDDSGLGTWQTLSSHGTQVFTSSGTFVAPPGISNVVLTLVGGGGGGGGGYNGGGGGGGGGAAVVNYAYPVSPGRTYPVVVGTGGDGGAHYDTGLTGGQSSFDGAIVANGGNGGRQAIGSGDGKGAVGGFNQINGNKFGGTDGTSATVSEGGTGGSSLLGNGARGGGPEVNGISAAPNSGGGGGGGGRQQGPMTRGGNGGSGIVIVTY